VQREKGNSLAILRVRRWRRERVLGENSSFVVVVNSGSAKPIATTNSGPPGQLETKNEVEAKEASCRHRRRLFLLMPKPSSCWLLISCFTFPPLFGASLSVALSLLDAVADLQLDFQR
jgi:hypothetical protein